MLDTSDVPGGVINIVTGVRDELAPVLAAHDDVDGLWYFGTAAGIDRGRAAVGGQHEADLGGLRPGPRLDRPATMGEGEEFLEQATQVKNIWVPYGE